MLPDIIAKIGFYRTDQGGRKGPILGLHLNCVFELEDQSNDCRLLIYDGQPIKPGDTAVLPIQFLCPNLVLPKLSVGTKFFLWASGNFAQGEVLDISTPIK